MEKLVEANPDAMMVIDHEGVVRFANTATESLLGRPAQSLQQMTFTDLLANSDGAEVDLSPWSEAFTVADLRKTEIEWEGKPAVLLTLRNSTKQNKLRHNRKQLLQFQQSIINSLTSQVAILDEQANVVAVNDAWRRFGNENGMRWPNHGVGANYLEVTDSASGHASEGATEAAAGIRRLLEDAEGEFTSTYPAPNPEGQHWFYMRAQMLHTSYGKRVFVAHQDITQCKSIELELYQALEDLRKSRQQILYQERQRALSQMASGIAHDFNNALSPIKGFSKLLLDNPERINDYEKVHRYLESIYKAANSATQIIARMRKFYRPREDEETFAPFDLNQIVSDAVSMSKPRWKEQSEAFGVTISIETELQEALPPIYGNEGEFTDVLTNLIFNAVDAMNEGGTIRIRTQARENHVVLEVSDEGSGMSEETKDQCLTPFYTTKGEEGTGLGLASVQGIVERHKGEMNIDSREGEGTAIRITLPLSKHAPVEEDSQRVSPPSPLSLLVVDDDETQRELMRELLEADEHKVDTARDPLKALEKFDSAVHDLVISDNAMPGMSGSEFAKKIKHINPATPVIMVSGFAEALSGEKEPAAPDRIISKPATQDKLREGIRQVYEKT